MVYMPKKRNKRIAMNKKRYTLSKSQSGVDHGVSDSGWANDKEFDKNEILARP